MSCTKILHDDGAFKKGTLICEGDFDQRSAWRAAGEVSVVGIAVSMIDDAFVDAVAGVWDTASALVHFPEDALKYIAGADRFLGARSSWSNIGRNLSWKSNPIVRAIDVVNGMAFGGLDLLTGHSLHFLFNEKLGFDIPYFTPVPGDVRGLAGELSMALFLVAMPGLKQGLVQRGTAGVPKRMSPGDLAVPEGAAVEGICDKMSISRLGRNTRLIEKAKAEADAVPMNIGELRRLAEASPELYSPAVSRLLHLAGEIQASIIASLKELVEMQYDYDMEIIGKLREMAKVDRFNDGGNIYYKAEGLSFFASEMMTRLEKANLGGSAPWKIFFELNRMASCYYDQIIYALRRLEDVYSGIAYMDYEGISGIARRVARMIDPGLDRLAHRYFDEAIALLKKLALAKPKWEYAKEIASALEAIGWDSIHRQLEFEWQWKNENAIAAALGKLADAMPTGKCASPFIEALIGLAAHKKTAMAQLVKLAEARPEYASEIYYQMIIQTTHLDGQALIPLVRLIIARPDDAAKTVSMLVQDVECSWKSDRFMRQLVILANADPNLVTPIVSGLVQAAECYGKARNEALVSFFHETNPSVITLRHVRELIDSDVPKEAVLEALRFTRWSIFE